MISPLSFSIASILFFSFSFLLIWLAVCLFCWSFQKTSSWIYWFFEGFFYVSISFSSALILVISCLLPAAECFWSCSSSFFNFDDRGSILDLSCFSHLGIYCYKFSSRDCFKCVPEILVCCVFVLIGFEEHLYRLLRTCFIQSTFKSQLFSFHEVVWFLVSFLIPSSNLIVLWSERLFLMISILLHLLRSDLLPIMESILDKCDVVLRRMYIL